MQPFDEGGPFDKRYQQVLIPSIQAADLQPYRVDHDPGSAVPIDDIEEGIRNSMACVADITSGNLNVAFELGFALALKKRVVLIGKKGTPLPFNFRHRKIIFYDTDAPGDFKSFAEKVKSALAAAIAKAETTEHLADALLPTAGLKAHEIAALTALAQSTDAPGETVSAWSVRDTMERMGFNKVACTLGLTTLLRAGLVTQQSEHDHNGESYVAYRIEESGLSWLLTNQHLLELRTEPPKGAAVDGVPF
jgi:hypothetical protein